MDIGEYKISKSQIAEIRNLYEKLGWSIGELEHDLGRSLEELAWLQGISIISGAKLFLPEDYEIAEKVEL